MQDSKETFNQHTSVKKALLIEDQKIPGTVLQYALEGAGYQVTWIETGLAALKEKIDGNYDIVVCNIELRGINGFDIVKQYRENKVTVPILALTDDTEKLYVEYLKAGFDAVFYKPLSAKKFMEDLRDITEPQAQQQDETETNKFVNIKQAMRERDYTKPFLFDLLHDYVKTLSEEMTAIKIAAQFNNRTKIREILHLLRGGAAYCHLTHLSEVMGKVHNEVKQNEDKDINEILAPFYPAAEETIAEIKKILEDGQ